MIHTYLIKFKNQIRFNEIPLFRGAVINALPSDSSVLFHNHTQESGFVYRYPYIQYKRINGQAAIFCISDGIDAISEFFQNKPQTLNLGDNQITTDIESISPKQLLLQTWNQEFYYHLRKWVALNSENYRQYLEIESLTDRITFLERILIGNLLSFAKGLNVEITNEITCKITQMDEPRMYRIKGVKIMGFDLEFKTNMYLPDFMGLGKHVSIGYGMVTNMKKENN